MVLLAWAVGELALCPVRAAELSHSQPAGAAVRWGRAVSGLQTSIRVAGDVRVADKLTLHLAVRNIGGAAVRLGPGDKAFGWAFLGQDGKGVYSEKIFLARRQGDWPESLDSKEELRFQPIELSRQKVFPYRQGQLRIVAGYPEAVEGKPDPAPTGPVSEALFAGSAGIRWILVLTGAADREIVVVSNTAALDVLPPEIETLSPEAREAFVAKLLARFRRDAFSARSACRAATRLGPTIVPELIVTVEDRKAPTFARMWAATALADIGGERSADELIELLEDPEASVRYVVCYHGPKARSEKLDQAIAAKVQSAGDGRMTAYASVGFLVFRSRVPEGILKAGLESDDPRARAAVARALSQQANDLNVSRLVALLKDADEQVRSLAASALGKMKPRANVIVGPLIAALDAPGETARRRICQALSELTGKKLLYDPNADEKTRKQTVADWKTWWEQTEKNDGRDERREDRD